MKNLRFETVYFLFWVAVFLLGLINAIVFIESTFWNVVLVIVLHVGVCKAVHHIKPELLFYEN